MKYQHKVYNQHWIHTQGYAVIDTQGYVSIINLYAQVYVLHGKYTYHQVQVYKLETILAIGAESYLPLGISHRWEQYLPLCITTCSGYIHSPMYYYTQWIYTYRQVVNDTYRQVLVYMVDTYMVIDTQAYVSIVQLEDNHVQAEKNQ